MARHFVLEVPHRLGTAVAKQRTKERIEDLRARFGDKIGKNSVDWVGNDANITASAFGQTANATILIRDTSATIDVRLPLLLSPLSGKIESYISGVVKDAIRS